MAIRTTDDTMTLEIGNRVAATALAPADHEQVVGVTASEQTRERQCRRHH